MNLDYLNERDHNGRSPFEVADDWIRADPMYADMIRDKIATREDIALFFGSMKAESECARVPFHNPPIEVAQLPRQGLALMAVRMECDESEIRARVDGYIERMVNYHNARVAAHRSNRPSQ